jgi:hypothetical protein
MESEAGRLFVERAYEGRKDFSLSETRAATIGRLLEKIPALPAVIEKTAEAIKTKDPVELVTALGTEVQHAGQKAVSQTRELLGKVPGIGGVLHSLGSVAADRKDLGEAERRGREALVAFQQAGDKVGIAGSLRLLGSIALAQGERRRALTLLEAARQAAVEAGSDDLAGIERDLESARRAAGRPPQSTLSLDQAISFAMTD